MKTSRDIVNFIGIGAQKCGTTWIHQNLQQHHEIYVAEGKDKDTKFFTCYYDHGYQWYESNFIDAGPEQISGEVSTCYFYNSDAPQRIKLYNPAIKLFVCLRNPVERVISNHLHEVRAGHIDGRNLLLEDALDNNPAYILQSRYAYHLKNWYKFFEKDQLKVLLFDDIKHSPDQFMKQLYQFLDVDETFEPDAISQKANKSRIPANRYLENATRVTGRIMRATGLGPLVDKGRAAGFNDWLRNVNSKNDSNNAIKTSDEVKNTIYKILKDDINELAELTGYDLSDWSSDYNEPKA